MATGDTASTYKANVIGGFAVRKPTILEDICKSSKYPKTLPGGTGGKKKEDNHLRRNEEVMSNDKAGKRRKRRMSTRKNWERTQEPKEESARARSQEPQDEDKASAWQLASTRESESSCTKKKNASRGKEVQVDIETKGSQSANARTARRSESERSYSKDKSQVKEHSVRVAIETESWQPTDIESESHKQMTNPRTSNRKHPTHRPTTVKDTLNLSSSKEDTIKRAPRTLTTPSPAAPK